MKSTLLRIVFLLVSSLSALTQMQPFTLQEVKLTGGPFKNAQDVDLKYILALDPDKLLAPYLIDAGLPLKAQRYGNWERSGLDGHIGGHYLSARSYITYQLQNQCLNPLIVPHGHTWVNRKLYLANALP